MPPFCGSIPFVAGRVVEVDAPVEGARQADDRQDADVDALAENRGRLRLVVGLVGDTGRVVEVGVGLEDQPLGERVGVHHLVVAVAVGADRGRAAVHQGVLALAEREAEARHAGLVGVALPVAIEVVEDVPGELREPTRQAEDAHVDDGVRGVRDRHADQVEDVVLLVVPVGEGVACRRAPSGIENVPSALPRPNHTAVSPRLRSDSAIHGLSIGLSIFAPQRPPQICPWRQVPPLAGM